MTDDEFTEFEDMIWPKPTPEAASAKVSEVRDTSARSNLFPVILVVGFLFVSIALGGLYAIVSNTSTDQNDVDKDGVSNLIDSCYDGEEGWTSSLQTDHDGDGCRDSSEDEDDDNDGVVDLLDLYPLDPTEWVDSDGDGTGDNADPFPNDSTEWIDSDGDGYGDNSDVFPNNVLEWDCLLYTSPSPRDS